MLRSFRLQVIGRVVLLGLTLALGAALAALAESYVAAGLAGLAALAQGVSLVRYVDKTNRDLSRFLLAFRYGDMAQSFGRDGRGPSFDELSDAFSQVMDDVREARSEKEEQARYLQTVIQHVGVGLLSFRQNGSVEFINTAAKRLLRVPRLRHIRALETISPKLAETLLTIAPGTNTLLTVADDDELLQLSIYATAFKLRDGEYKLVSIQNIGTELDEKESEAWQKLTRVLTHEIMNSITPIASLASTAHGLLAGVAPPPKPREAEALGDVRSAVETIERRSQGLLGFVQDYRSLTRVPQPDLQITEVAALLEHVAGLLKPEMEARGVRLVVSVEPKTLTVAADVQQLEQVLINLAKNALEAAACQPGAEVQLLGRLGPRGRTLLQVVDNGPGIVEEALGKIFIPFFTTKKDGSGIGLSLSREIMRRHGGTIRATSNPDARRTVFTLRF